MLRRNSATSRRRVLVVDDNRAIHEDFRKILGPGLSSTGALAQSEAALFGDVNDPAERPTVQIDSAYHGEEGVALVRQAVQENSPYSVAFIDVRMPPGADGIETAARIWEQDSEVQIVICTAYTDHSWEQIRRKLGGSDRLFVLKKPFDNIEVLQLVDTLTEKWQRARLEQRRLQDLEDRIGERNRDLEAARRINASLDEANQRLMATAQAPEEIAQTRLRRSRALERALRRAIQTEELTVHYQPLVHIATQRVVSLEALARWSHPKVGWISPGEFVPVAEASGLIVPLGERVLRTACCQVVQWEKEGVSVVPVAVNLSSVQFARLRMWDYIRGILRETGMQPQRLALELTESALMVDPARHVSALQGLRADGVHVQIDDFGTGYSSLSYLRQLPIDTLKIDRSFISHVDTSASDEAIVAAILAMSRTLGLRVVAEGVETAAQLEVLARHGCEVAQGYYFSRPLPAEQCRELLLDLASRPSLTDTLRMRLTERTSGTPPLTATDVSPVRGVRR